MSKLIYCCIEPCFRKMLVDKPDQLLKLGWAKIDDNYSCENHTWEKTDEL